MLCLKNNENEKVKVLVYNEKVFVYIIFVCEICKSISM